MTFGTNSSFEQTASHASKTKVKKVYVTPRLVEFGTIRQLAQGGTGSMVEGSLMMAGDRHP